MTTLREAAQQALKAMEREAEHYLQEHNERNEVLLADITALRAALAEPVQEPERTRALIEECRAALAEELMAWDIDPPLHHVKRAHDKCEAWLAAPPQRKPLTDDDLFSLWESHYSDPWCDYKDFARAIERAHGIGADDAQV